MKHGRVIALLLAVLMCVSMFPMAGMAADEDIAIATVNAQVSAPIIGDKPAAASEIVLTARDDYLRDVSTGISICSIEWNVWNEALESWCRINSEDYVFETGKKYRMDLWALPKDNYTISSNISGTVNEYISSTQNGAVYDEEKYSTVSAHLSYIWTAGTYVSKINAEIPQPVAGQTLPDASDIVLSATPENAGVYLENDGIFWYIQDQDDLSWTMIYDSDYIVQEGENYCIDLYPITEDGYCFHKNIEGTVNGQPSNITDGAVYRNYDTVYLSAHWNHVTKDPCAEYIDIDRTKWYHEGIDFVISNGLMSDNGYVDGKPKFSPNAKVTRAMVAMILYRMGKNEYESEATYQGTFTDVPEGKWYTAAIEWCAQNGLAEGKGNGKFDPNGYVTRQELALFMMRMAAYQGKSTTGGANLSGYPDAAKVANWAKEAVSWAVGEGLITGNTIKGVDYLSPKDSATRAQLATILMRYMNQ